MSETSTPEITLAGRKFQARLLDPYTDFAEAEAYARQLLKDPVEAILPALEALRTWAAKTAPTGDAKADPAALAAHAERQRLQATLADRLLDRAYADLRRQDQPLAPEEVQRWLDTVEGHVFLIWVLLRDQNEELKELDAVRVLVRQAVQQEGERQALARLRKERDATLPNGAKTAALAEPSVPATP